MEKDYDIFKHDPPYWAEGASESEPTPQLIQKLLTHKGYYAYDINIFYDTPGFNFWRWSASIRKGIAAARNITTNEQEFIDNYNKVIEPFYKTKQRKVVL